MSSTSTKQFLSALRRRVLGRRDWRRTTIPSDADHPRDTTSDADHPRKPLELLVRSGEPKHLDKHLDEHLDESKYLDYPSYPKPDRRAKRRRRRRKYRRVLCVAPRWAPAVAHAPEDDAPKNDAPEDDAPKDMPVCGDYLRRNCWRGAACKYAHSRKRSRPRRYYSR